MTRLQRRAIQAGVLAVVGLACVGETLSVTILPDRLEWWLSLGPFFPFVLDIVPGSSFVLAGLVAWSLRPRNRVGLLMMGVGVGLLLPSLARPFATSFVLMPANTEQLPTRFVAEIFMQTVGGLWAVVLLHLLLGFPEGRLVSRLDRVLVRFFYVAVPVLGLLVPVFVLADLRPPATAAHYIPIAFGAIGLGLLLRRWIFGGYARRRSLSPLFWPAVTLAVLFVAVTSLSLARLDWGRSLLGISPRLLLIALPLGFLIGLYRTGLDMSSVGDLVVSLSSGLAPDQLQPALARALHDPSLEVVYWLPTHGWFADLAGRRIELPAAGSERAASVLGDPAAPVAALVYDSSLVHEGHLVDTAAAAVRLAVENARLQVELRAQLEEVRQSRARLVDAADSERRRVERDLHDGAQQQLVTLLLSLQVTKTEALTHHAPATAAMLDANIAALKQALDELRELARGIHPTILTEAGLVPAVLSLAERCPIPVKVTGDLDGGRLPPQLEAALYFVVAEAITNAVKHSKGRRIYVAIGCGSGLATVEVSDDGVGGAELSAGSGLRGLSDRVAAVGGRLVVTSHSGAGTTVHSEVPCA